MKNTTLLLVICSVALSAHATPWETKPQTLEDEPAAHATTVSTGTYAHHNNYFSIGPVSTELGTGLSLGYAMKVTSQLKIGIQFSSLQGGHRSEGSGDLVSGQFYKENYYHTTQMSSLNLSYYPRDEGVSRWGPFMRAQVGYAKVRSTAGWERYDQDPGFFNGGKERKIEDKSYDKDWGTIYSRLGAYYQFPWNFGEGARVGHVLELGLGINSLAQTESISYVKPNGTTVENHPGWASPFAEVNYSIAF